MSEPPQNPLFYVCHYIFLHPAKVSYYSVPQFVHRSHKIYSSHFRSINTTFMLLLLNLTFTTIPKCGHHMQIHNHEKTVIRLFCYYYSHIHYTSRLFPVGAEIVVVAEVVRTSSRCSCDLKLSLMYMGRAIHYNHIVPHIVRPSHKSQSSNFRCVNTTFMFLLPKRRFTIILKCVHHTKIHNHKNAVI